MFNLQHILYMVISGLLTVLLLILSAKCVRREKSKKGILYFWAIVTVVIHYSNLWVNYFTTGGNATIENNHILPVYPCNVVMWTLFACALIRDKKSLPFQLLAEFSFYAGIAGGVIGIVVNKNFGNTPTLADYDILKGMVSHSTMLIGCIYLLVGKFITINRFNLVSITAGTICFVVCGLGVDWLYALNGMEPPDGMFLQSNPYVPFSPVLVGLGILAVLLGILTVWERKLPTQERWYAKLIKKK